MNLDFEVDQLTTHHIRQVVMCLLSFISVSWSIISATTHVTGQQLTRWSSLSHSLLRLSSLGWLLLDITARHGINHLDTLSHGVQFVAHTMTNIGRRHLQLGILRDRLLNSNLTFHVVDLSA